MSTARIVGPAGFVSRLHERREQSMAAMQNHEPEPDHAPDFVCRVCGDAVWAAEAAELGLSMEACRDHTLQRVAQLMKAEQELARLKSTVGAEFVKIALWAQDQAKRAGVAA